MIHIAIIGRPNVGKSTLFNRLVGSRKSIVEPTPGVTRDINDAFIRIDDVEIMLYDTGGLLEKSDDILNDKVRNKTFDVAKNIDIILFLVDVSESHPDDRHFLQELRKINKPIILVVNKVDSESRESLVYDFQNLGVKDIVPISSEHGRGISELLEEMERVSLSLTPSGEENQRKDDEIKIAIVGKPNAGKSTFLNTILGKERSIVHDEAGTTRDSIDVHFTFNNDDICLIDTAGMRRKRNVHTSVEYYSVNRSVHAIEASDVCILLLDMQEGLTEQDKKIASLIIERKKGIVIAANKWDIREKPTTWNEYEAFMKDNFPVLQYAIYTKLTATHKTTSEKLLSLAIRVAKTRKMEYSTHSLTETMVRASRQYTLNVVRTSFKIFYVVQIGTNPPAFSIFSNHPEKLTFDYKRYLENKFREIFDFRGTPIVLHFKKEKEKGRGR